MPPKKKDQGASKKTQEKAKQKVVEVYFIGVKWMLQFLLYDFAGFNGP